MSGARPVRLLVCGSPDRGDDGAACEAVAALPARTRALADVRHVGGLDVDCLLDCRPGQAVVIIDAVLGVPAGETVVRTLAELARDGRGPASSHALPLDQVLGLVRVLRGDLPAGVFVGIGGASFGYEARPSPAVLRGLPAFRAAIEAEVARFAAGAR